MIRSGGTAKAKLFLRAREFAGLGLVAVAFCAVIVSQPSLAIAGSSIPKYAQRVAGGSTAAGDSWSIWIFGHRLADRCWATKTVEDGFSNEDALCGFSVPARPWQLAAKGTFGSGRDQESMLFFLTRKSIVSLKVQVVKDRDHQAWTNLTTLHLSSQDAKNAQITPNFSYAVGTTFGPLSCVGRVIATTRSGKKVSGSQSSSCATQGRE